MKMTKIKAFVLISVFLVGCVSTNVNYEKPTSRKTNYAALYDPGSSNINPHVRPYHASTGETFVFFKVNLGNMMPTPGNDQLQGGGLRLGVKYAIRNAQTREIVDSASLSYNFKPQERGVFINYFPTSLKSDQDYFASIIFFDKNKKSYKRSVFNINKSTTGNANYFFPEYLTLERVPLFYNFISGNRKIRITSDLIAEDSVRMLRFPVDSLCPAAPYVTGQAISGAKDPAFISCYRMGDTVSLDTAGFYWFTTDTAITDGLGIYRESVFFPWVRQTIDMVNPVKYISTPKEYENIITHEDTKLAVDKFWYSLGETKDRAKELIRIYYNRVQLANRFFTATKAGWRTDRGMVYVVLGAPHEVYKDEGKEKWVYGAEDNYQGLMFTFVRDSASLSNNEFLLIRDKRYKNAWMQAVQSWRKGYAYSVPE
ncbi:MAG: GWxTD domain-containing protein [Bacteroidota bacterium]|nr:GWxTD domain-containing protein [Bacteroidota bacterium]